MAIETQKCPMCSTKLKKINGRMTCKDCGYYIREESAYDIGSPSGNPSGSSSGSPSGSSSGSPGKYVPSNSKGGSGTTPKQGSAAKKIAAVLGSVVLFVILVVLRSGVIGDIIESWRDLRPDPVPITRPTPAANLSSGSPASAARQTPSPTAAPTAAPTTARYPESQFFCSFVEAVYGKGYRAVTPEEYAAVTAFGLDNDQHTIYYQLNYGETRSLFFDNTIGMKLSDLSCFPGLTWLSLPDEDLSAKDLVGLNDLYTVFSDNTLEELAKIIPHPENILELGVEDSIFVKDLRGLENFPNLLYLTVDYGFLEDISAISALPDLLGLTLVDCDRLTDYSPLMSMTQMEELSIQSEQLKTLDFVKQMPNLVYLSLEDTKIKNISALAECPELISLRLIDNYSITDYSVIGSLTNLTDLAFSASYDAVLPSFEKLTALSNLYLEDVHDLTPLKDAVNVTVLGLEDCTSENLEVITGMQGLISLSLNDIYFSHYTDLLEPLTKLPNLIMLDIRDSYFHGNIEEIFGIPTLKYLYLDDCRTGMDFDALPANDNLLLLSMCNITIWEDPESYYDRGYIELSDHSDMFAKYPNLIELYLSDNNLDDIDFVADLPNLSYLDITNNNITSLTPLSQLSNFNIVWCGRNSILENLPEDSDVLVLTNRRN